MSPFSQHLKHSQNIECVCPSGGHIRRGSWLQECSSQMKSVRPLTLKLQLIDGLKKHTVINPSHWYFIFFSRCHFLFWFNWQNYSCIRERGLAQVKKWQVDLAISNVAASLVHVHESPRVSWGKEELKIPSCLLQNFLCRSISLPPLEQSSFYHNWRPEVNRQFLAVNCLSLTTNYQHLAKNK